MHCSASSLTGYEYPGGGTDDLVPRNSLLVEREPAWWGDSFINIPADDAGQPLGASTGVIFKTRGPIFNTYVYQERTAARGGSRWRVPAGRACAWPESRGGGESEISGRIGFAFSHRGAAPTNITTGCHSSRDPTM